jgi:hypothetical protein
VVAAVLQAQQAELEEVVLVEMVVQPVPPVLLVQMVL